MKQQSLSITAATVALALIILFFGQTNISATVLNDWKRGTREAVCYISNSPAVVYGFARSFK